MIPDPALVVMVTMYRCMDDLLTSMSNLTHCMRTMADTHRLILGRWETETRTP